MKTASTIVSKQAQAIEAGSAKIRACIDLTEQELFWAMIDLGSQYLEKKYRYMAPQLKACPLFWAEFKLWWHMNNNRFLSEITTDDLTYNGLDWAKHQYMEAQLKWCLDFYKLSNVVVEEALK